MSENIVTAFNRTIVELKPEFGITVGGETTSFNRTIVELKLFFCTFADNIAACF